jgi:hypothetical protein
VETYHKDMEEMEETEEEVGEMMMMTETYMMKRYNRKMIPYRKPQWGGVHPHKDYIGFSHMLPNPWHVCGTLH